MYIQRLPSKYLRIWEKINQTFDNFFSKIFDLNFQFWTNLNQLSKI